MTNGDSSKAIAIARSLEGINGLFTGCGIMCKRMSNFTTSSKGWSLASGIVHIRPNTQASPQQDPTHWAQSHMHRMACLVPASAGTRYCCRLGPITWSNHSININR